jgi:phage gp36-like protein
MYFKKVEVTGTQAAPQTFVTNAGTLALTENGDAFPSIDLTSQVANIVLTSYQDCQVNRVGDITQSGTDITFQLAISNIGNASSDGKYYVTIDISVYGLTVDPGTHYCSQLDIENRISRLTLAQLTNDTANATTADVSVVDAILTNINATIDSLAGQVYTVPFTTVPPLVRRIAIDLACYEVMQRRPVNMDMPKGWQSAHDKAMKQLEAISNMLLRLPATATVASSESAMVTGNSARIDFSNEDNMEYNF